MARIWRCRHRRLTPANAGTTSADNRVPPAGTAHPRECGDDRAIQVPSPSRTGSPPRMRGRQSNGCALKLEHRLTPANAGTTDDCLLVEVDGPAHPRECGDDKNSPPLAVIQDGSPPRMRGRPQPVRGGGVVGGLTPANAGTTESNLG